MEAYDIIRLGREGFNMVVNFKKHRSVIFAVFAILMTLFIFSNSLKTAPESASDSSFFENMLMYLSGKIGIFIDFGFATVFVRKLAYITEFFLQSLFIGLAYHYSKNRCKGRVVNILFFGLMTACLDEFLQGFILGRGSLVSDILIDFTGVFASGVIYLLLARKNKG